MPSGDHDFCAKRGYSTHSRAMTRDDHQAHGDERESCFHGAEMKIVLMEKGEEKEYAEHPIPTMKVASRPLPGAVSKDPKCRQRNEKFFLRDWISPETPPAAARQDQGHSVEARSQPAVSLGRSRTHRRAPVT